MNNQEASLQTSGKSSRISTAFLFFCLAPVLSAFSGFHTAGYILAGLYTWPRTSRVIVLTIGVLIFSYEFIFRNAHLPTANWRRSPFESVIYTSIIPYALGAIVLMVVAGTPR